MKNICTVYTGAMIVNFSDILTSLKGVTKIFLLSLILKDHPV